MANEDNPCDLGRKERVQLAGLAELGRGLSARSPRASPARENYQLGGQNFSKKIKSSMGQVGGDVVPFWGPPLNTEASGSSHA